MPESTVTLYIYRVGWTYPTRNPIYRSKSMKISNCIRTLHGPVRPARPTGQTGWSCQTSYRNLDLLDRLGIPVRQVSANFGRQQVANEALDRMIGG